jgi:hypothetical protein
MLLSKCREKHHYLHAKAHHHRSPSPLSLKNSICIEGEGEEELADLQNLLERTGLHCPLVVLGNAVAYIATGKGSAGVTTQ